MCAEKSVGMNADQQYRKNMENPEKLAFYVE